MSIINTSEFKKIIFDCERMKNPHTGLYHFCKQLGAALLKQIPPNYQFNFYLPENEKHVFGNRENEGDIIQKALHKFFKAKFSNCDLWHSTFQMSDYIPYKNKRQKIITTIHDLNFLHSSKDFNKQKKYIRKVQKTIDRSDVIVVISHFVKEEVTSYLQLRGKPIEVIYNGRNKPPSGNLLQPANVFQKPFFYTIGTIVEKKNFHVLPALLLHNDHDLVISGITQSEAYKQKIIDEAARLGVSNRVKFTGAVTEAEKYWLLKNCSAFVFPSLSEGFGLPVIEAMQTGTPVLLSKATSLPEVGGPHALYFNELSTEGVSSLASEFLEKDFSEEDRNKLVAWASQFDWDKAATAYWNIYNSLLK